MTAPRSFSLSLSLFSRAYDEKLRKESFLEDVLKAFLADIFRLSKKALGIPNMDILTE